MEKDHQNIAILSIVFIALVFFFFGGFGMMSGYGMMGLGMIIGLLIFLALIGLVVWIVISLQNTGGSHETSLSILKKRYAKGEITKKEYEEMRKEIER